MAESVTSEGILSKNGIGTSVGICYTDKWMY